MNDAREPEASSDLVMYQFLEPFVVDTQAFERAFELPATPLREGLTRTVAWHRAREG